MTNEVDYKTEADPTLVSLWLPVFYKPSIIWRKRSSHEYQRGKVIHIIYDMQVPTAMQM